MLYALTRLDGSVSIMTLMDASDPQAEIAKWPDEERAKILSATEIVEVPNDRTFRDAWQMVDQRVDIHMPKAREIYRDKLRQARTPMLASLDIDFLRAAEADDSDAKKSIATKKQALRDMPEDPQIEAANTVEELKAIDHSSLGLELFTQASKI